MGPLAEKAYGAAYYGESDAYALAVARKAPAELGFDESNTRDGQLLEWGLFVGLTFAIATCENPFGDNADAAHEAASEAFSTVRRELEQDGIEGEED